MSAEREPIPFSRRTTVIPSEYRKPGPPPGTDPSPPALVGTPEETPPAPPTTDAEDAPSEGEED